MSDVFRASNGIDIAVVDTDPETDAVLLVDDGLLGTQLTAVQVEALREFLQRERDHLLGRWRWPDDPRFVVYQVDTPIGTGRIVRVVDESTGEGEYLNEKSFDSQHFGIHFQPAVRAYFEAHPEPKPWHDAKPGEVWEITYRSPCGSEISNRVMTCVDDGGNISFFNDYRLHTIYYTGIKSARRIWPEVS